MEKRKQKKKFNVVKFLIFIIVLYIIGFGIYKIITMPIRHIRILNTTYLQDQDILEMAKLDDYPSFLFTTSSSIKENLTKNPFIKNVKIEKKWFSKVYIYIEENKVLFYNRSLGKAILEGNIEVLNNDFVLPHLINYVPDDIYIKLTEKMSIVDNSVLIKISEIEYRPNEVDKERFLLTMNDGNYIFLTLYTFDKINKYNKIVSTFEGKKGILNLDAGNYFELID
ncbi:MAG TPA: FtsQ-type POTRA domain-containing protein [Mollicutes bacterium]|jgi:cell division septal protein FtsQ|nr:FtsQ-type POTRA domain-containing protein [Mollicutes bacterium]